MTEAYNARRTHDLLNNIIEGYIPSKNEIFHLRSFLPELPAQKTLTEISHDVYRAWYETHSNDWKEGKFGDLDGWLLELYTQLQELKDTPISITALPAGMRLADHAVYGRVVVAPKPYGDGDYRILVLDDEAVSGMQIHYAFPDSLTFIDAEPSEPAHPEFLETEADYENAPNGTIVARDGNNPWVKGDDVWVQVVAADATAYMVPCLKGTRRVLRWGWGKDTETTEKDN